MNQVILLTGPAGAGKSSVAEAICERFDRMLHVSMDDIRHWVKAGYRHPWLDSPQAAEQRELATRNAASVASNAIALRYAVVIDDVILADDAERYREQLAGLDCNVHFVLLLPTLETAVARDRDRAADVSAPDRVRPLHEQFARESQAGALPGAVIDSTGDANAAMTADRVQDVVASGEALFIAGSI
ncbi:MAG TPA: AAA family ATPase [Dehalococcoidia bacterium]|nr:AAA family ATPase [Dehalococcoidia bacterium]